MISRLSLYHRIPKSIPKLSRNFSSQLYYADEEPPPLVELESAKLAYPNSKNLTNTLNLRIEGPKSGGHVLLGRNASGKSLISNALRTRGESYVEDGSLSVDRLNKIAHVSFESHEELLKKGETAYKAIAQGNLNKAAQFLVVRFGLYPLLYRPVDTLSTGEIRKVMLVRALATRPKLLVLDNAFDGLDVPSRDVLKDLVSKTLKGFRPDILVQAVSAKDTAHTQILMSTHRAEEIVPEMSTVSIYKEGHLTTLPRKAQTGQELLSSALDLEDIEISEPWEDTTLGLPSVDSIRSWWKSGSTSNEPFQGDFVVEAKNLYVKRGDATLIHNMDWKVKNGESWLVAGHNGSGKSTLSRLLAREEHGVDSGSLHVMNKPASTIQNEHQMRKNIGWVSTELHMAEARSQDSAMDVLVSHGQVPPEVARSVADWLNVGNDHILSRPFAQLSQGEQKLILIASAMAVRPKVLILDEPCQGLDLINRRRVLGLMEHFCKATDVSLIYITHHYEEVIPSVSHVLHLKGGKDVYNGHRDQYDPNLIHDDD